MINHLPEVPVDEPIDLEEGGQGGRPSCDKDDSEDILSPKARWREYFPRCAGQALRREPTMFESMRNTQVAQNQSIWGRFSDEGDWEIARWIVESGTTHTSTNDLLELKTVSKQIIVKCTTYQSVADSTCRVHFIPQ
jgi:hypothetical protein